MKILTAILAVIAYGVALAWVCAKWDERAMRKEYAQEENTNE